MSKKTTLRKIIETSVSGLKRDFLTESEKQEMVDYILKWSTQQVCDKWLLLSSASQLGISKEQSEQEIKEHKFITFYWGGLDVDNKVYEDSNLPSREWQLKSHKDLEQLEQCLLMQVEGLYNCMKGQMVVIIDGKVQEYKILEDDTAEGFKKQYIDWQNNLEPYELVFMQEGEKGFERIIEHYSNKRVLELRIMQVLQEGGKSLQVFNTLSDKTLHFWVSQIVYESFNPLKDKEMQLQWKTWGIEEEQEYEDCI